MTSVMGRIPNPHPIAEGIPYIAPLPSRGPEEPYYPFWNWRCVCSFCFPAATFFVFVLWLQGVFNAPYLPIIHVNSASLSELKVNNRSGVLSANWTITFEFWNKNNHRNSMDYEHLVAWIGYGKHSYALSSATLADFHQNGRKRTTFVYQFNASEDSVDGDVIEKIMEDRSRGLVGFDVEVSGYVKYRHWMKILISGYCEHVRFGFSTNDTEEPGRWLGRRRKCWVSNF